MHSQEIFDVIIIGGGPTGMFSAFSAGMRDLKVKIIETLPALGGQIDLMYPEKVIFDIGAIPYIKGKDLIAQLAQQMEPFDIDICLEESVTEIEKEEDIFYVRTTEGIHYSKSILLTTGVGSFEPRKLTFDYNLDYEKTNLHYYVSDLEDYKDKVIAICGGGDSAVDWALTLEGVAKEVYIIHRREHFRAFEASVNKLRNSSVQIITPYIPQEVIGNDFEITEIVCKETRGNKTISLPVDYFIVNFGFISNNHQLDDWGLETSSGSVLVSQKMETNIPGIFAAGDVCAFDGKVKLIASGFGEAPTAINSIIQYLNPEKFIQAPLSADSDMAHKFKEHFAEDN